MTATNAVACRYCGLLCEDEQDRDWHEDTDGRYAGGYPGWCVGAEPPTTITTEGSIT